MPPTGTATPVKKAPAKKAPAKKASQSKTILPPGPAAPLDSNKYALTAWGGMYEDLTVPSGQTCQVRRVSLPDLVEADVLDKLDTLTVLVNQKVLSKKQKGRGKTGPTTEQQIAELMKDPAKLREMMETIWKVVQYVVVQPSLSLPPGPKMADGKPVLDDDGKQVMEDRNPAAIYVDVLGQDDLMYIFNFAMGGSTDLARFRAELDQRVASLDDGQGVGEATE